MTEPADLRAYQADAGLDVDGVLGDITRASLIADEMATHVSDLIGFRLSEGASLGLIIQCEGFKGRPYWPGGQSGVTLDYGWDLADKTESDLRLLYGHLWPDRKLEGLSAALGLRGQCAKAWLSLPWPSRAVWPITSEQAAQILPRAAGPYWHAAAAACPALRDAPARVQTALLSVTYSAWVGPVQVMRQHIERAEWKALAVGVRQAKGAKARREIEARLIESVEEGV